jgi:hypothetical protein
MLTEIPWTTIIQTVVKLASVLFKRYQDDVNTNRPYCEQLLHNPLLHSLLIFFLLLGASVKESLKTAEYMVQKREPGACRNMIGYTSHQYSQQGYNKLFTQVTHFNRPANIVLLLFFSFVETKFYAVNYVSSGNVQFNDASQLPNKRCWKILSLLLTITQCTNMKEVLILQ